MISFIYSAIAIAFLLVVLLLSVKTRSSHQRRKWAADNPASLKIGNGRWLHLSERIFDPADVHWLAEELSLPNLAQSLTDSRKRLAICWLEALQSSFDEFVRFPQYPLTDEVAASAGGWQLLWLTLRFKLSVSCALFVVKWFGPYHRLIPSFSWLPSSQNSERRLRRPAFANSRSAR